MIQLAEAALGFQLPQVHLPGIAVLAIALTIIVSGIKRPMKEQRLGWARFGVRVLGSGVALAFFTALPGGDLSSRLVGIPAGVLLGVLAAVGCRFEVREGRVWYRPNRWIGAALGLALGLRLLARWTLVWRMTAPSVAWLNFVLNPFDRGLVLAFLAYLTAMQFTVMILQTRREAEFTVLQRT